MILSLCAFAFLAVSSVWAADGKVVRPIAVIHSVADLDKSAAFYRNVFGLELEVPGRSPSVAARWIEALTNGKADQIRSATLVIPGSDMRLVLAQFSSSHGNPIAEQLQTSEIQDPGTVKLGFRVRNFPEALSRLTKSGVQIQTAGRAPVLPEGPAGPNAGIVVRDPDGFFIEVLGNNPQAQTPAPAPPPGDAMVTSGWADIIAEQVEKVVPFYAQLSFAVQPARDFAPPANPVALMEGTPTATLHISVAKPPGGMPRWFIWDFQGINREPVHGNIHDPGTAALSFLVQDMPAFLASLKANGTPAETVAIDHSQVALVRDPSGILVELVEE